MPSLIEILISLAFTGIGIIGGYAFQRIADRRQYLAIATPRQRKLTATWTGTVQQVATDDRAAVELPITLELQAGSRTIRGSAKIEDEGRLFEFDVDGAFLSGSYLRLNYSAEKSPSAALDFGVLFLRVGDIPETMTGRLVGYGSITNSLINGTVEVKRQDENAA